MRKPLAGAAHAAFEHVAHAELARDLLHVDRAVLVDECRVARDDEQPADAGQAGDQVFRNAVGEILLIRIVAHVGERQHRDRGTVGQRQRAGVAVDGSIGPGRRHFPDEPVTAAVQCLDIAGTPRIVAQRLPKFLDAGHQRRIAHVDLGPDRGEQLILGDHLAGALGNEATAAQALWA